MTRSRKTLRVIFDGSIYTVIVIFVLILIFILIFIFVLIILYGYIVSFISAVSGEIPESVITILMSSSDA